MPGGTRRTNISVKEVKGQSGRLLLIEEESRRLAIERFNNEIGSARRGMVVSPISPTKIKPRLEGGIVKWLTRTKGGLNPTRLDYDVFQEISKFYKDAELEGQTGVVLLMGMEYLSLVNGFKNLARFIKKIGDRASSTDGALIVGLNPSAFDGKEIVVLEKTFDYVERSGVGARVVERLESGKEMSGWSYLVIDDKGFRDLKRFKEDAICLTSLQPEKVRRWTDFRGDVIWVSESEEKGALHPSKLRFEIQQRVLKVVVQGCKVIFVDALEQLILFSGIPDVAGFVKTLSDACAQNNSVLIAALDPKALERRDYALFRCMFDTVIG